MHPSDLHGPWTAIRRAPMLRIASLFVAGILIAWFFDPPLQPLIWLLGIGGICAAVVVLFPGLPRTRWQRGVVLGIWFLAAGIVWQSVRTPVSDPLGLHRLDQREGPWLARVEAINGDRPKVIRVDVSILARFEKDSVRPVRGGALATLLRSPGEPTPVVGDLIILETGIDPIDRLSDPGGFDRRQWAASRGIRHELFATEGHWRVSGHTWQWVDAFRELRERISTWLDGSELGLRERALVKALVLGERDELDGDLRESFMRSGTIHVLAVSGMHVGLIYAILTFMVGWWGKGRGARILRGVLILVALWGYAGLTGASPSVLRASVMFSFFTIAGMALQRSDNLNSLFAAAFLLLVWDPGMLEQAGFQLSFLAVLGIILFYRPIERSWFPRWSWLHKVWSLAALSISAQLLTTPVSLHLFKAFPIWFLPANLIVVVAAGLAVYGGIALIALYKVPFVGAALTWAMTMLLGLVERTTAFFAALPGSYPAVRVGLSDMVLMYVLVLSAGAWLQWRWRSAWYTALLCACALLGIWGQRAGSRNTTDSFIVYDQREGALAGMVHGRELVVWASADSSVTSKYTQAKLARHQRTVGIDTMIFIVKDSLPDRVEEVGHSIFTSGRWRSARFDVLFVSGDDEPAVDPHHRFDAIVIHDADRMSKETGATLIASTDHLVIAGGVTARVRRILRTLAADRPAALHEVSHRGAFTLER